MIISRKCRITNMTVVFQIKQIIKHVRFTKLHLNEQLSLKFELKIKLNVWKIPQSCTLCKTKFENRPCTIKVKGLIVVRY